MHPLTNASRPDLRFNTVLVLAGCFLAFVSWDQSYWWTKKADYTFGWLVPACVAYVLYDRWPLLVRVLRSAPRQAETKRARDIALERLCAAVAWTVLGISLLTFLFGAAYRSAGGPSNPATLAITSGTTGVLLSCIYLSISTLHPNATLEKRLRFTALFIFPTVVWLISAPLVGIVEAKLNIFLMKEVTTVVFRVFDALGLSLEQRGNVLILPTGSVGVAEACSGIRSLTGCLFAGSFLAAVFTEGWKNKLTLIASALGLALCMNLLRSLFLTGWSYRYGAESMEKNVHDLAGYAVLGLTVVGLLIILPLLAKKPSPASV